MHKTINLNIYTYACNCYTPFVVFYKSLFRSSTFVAIFRQNNFTMVTLIKGVSSTSLTDIDKAQTWCTIRPNPLPIHFSRKILYNHYFGPNVEKYAFDNYDLP